MASDYDQIRSSNIKEYGEGTRHLAFLGRLYSKRTHFIFELLQNAEDAGANRVEFRLWQDRLELLHDGRVFNGPDVRGVCGVGESTNQGDLTRIGRFGVGFKSVYAYVDVPEIHSGDEHFRIEHYVRPFAIQSRKPEEGFTTLFVLPLGGAGIQAQEAAAEIKTALRGLNPTTLLFLRKIELVIVESEGQKIARFMREVLDTPSPNVRRLRLEASSAKGGEEDWLVFDRPVSLIEGKEKLRVEAAFRLQRAASGKREEIIEIEQSPLVVFFPTEKPTNLGFLVQGPYRTTPARDNVPENDPTNCELVRQTGELVVDAVKWLKTAGLLTVPVLKCLPINRTQFPVGSMFRPLFEIVQLALKKEKLIPAFSLNRELSEYEAGAVLKAAGSADLRNLVSPSQLSSLCAAATPLSWLSPEITADRTPLLWDYLRQEIGVEELDAEGFVRKLTLEFLSSQSDDWLAELYGFLAGQRAWLSSLRWGSRHNVLFLTKPIIRLEDGRHIRPLREDGSALAFLPPDGTTSFDCVKKSITGNKEAREFLVNLGFAVPDECDAVLKHLLPQYAKGEIPDLEIYRTHIDRIFAALKTDSASKKSALIEKLKSLRFLRAKNATTDQIVAKSPREVYFSSAELELYFKGNSEAWFLDAELEIHREQLIGLGVAETVRVFAKPPSWDGHVIIRNSHSSHERGLNGFDPECQIEGLDYALKHPNPERSAMVWNQILCPRTHLVFGGVEWSSRQDYCYSKKKEGFSNVGKIANAAQWLPNTTGKYQSPSELALESLPERFERNETLARCLGMRLPTLPPSANDVAQLAQSVGVSLDDIEFLKQYKNEFAEFKVWKTNQKQKPIRPQNESRDPKGRAERVTEQAHDSTNVEIQKRERSIRVNWINKDEAKATLRELNTNDHGQMVCQICGDEMPFKLEDGSYYFEAVECVKELSRELLQNYIALCPICAAKFRHANGTPANELKQRILLASGSEVPINLARVDCGIIFTKIHLLDLQSALKTV